MISEKEDITLGQRISSIGRNSAALKEEADRLQRRIEKIKVKQEESRWRLVMPEIVRELNKILIPGYRALSWGPFGLGNTFSITVERVNETSKRVFCRSVELRPSGIGTPEFEVYVVLNSRYAKKKYPANSIGAVNGLDRKKGPVIQSVGQLVKLMRLEKFIK